MTRPRPSFNALLVLLLSTAVAGTAIAEPDADADADAMQDPAQIETVLMENPGPVEDAVEIDDAVRLEDAAAGELLFRSEHEGLFVPAPALEADVSIHVVGLVARTAVRQRFHNPHDAWLEGVYVFPLPDDSAVDTLRVVVGERVIEGVILEREEARQVYEEARQEGRRAGLVEQERPNLFTTSVANIGPDETIDVVIEYQQEVRYDTGRFELRFPMALTPRYVPPGGGADATGSDDSGSDATVSRDDVERIQPPRTTTPRMANLELWLDASVPIARVESPSHALHQMEDAAVGGFGTRVAPADGLVTADRDFVVRWWPERASEPQVAVVREVRGGEEYLLLFVVPPEPRTTRHLERETIFVLDTSGSMSGPSIRQAKLALLRALDRLEPTDTFNVIDFDSDATKIFDHAVPADAWHLTIARQRIARFHAGGGTEIGRALSLALDVPDVARRDGAENDTPGRRLRQVVFITDGAVGNEREIFRRLHRELGASRLFTVGIGSAPNGHFLRGAARLGGGTHTFIASVEEVGTRMDELLTKIEHAALSDLEVTWQGATWSVAASSPDDSSLATFGSIWPRRPSDLYLGEPLTLVARLPAELATDIESVRIDGWRGSLPWRRTIELPPAREGDTIHRLWARRGVEALEDAAASGLDPDAPTSTLAVDDPVAFADDLKRRIVELGLAHGLVTRHTSLVAVDDEPARPDGTSIETARLPIALPHGWVPPQQLTTLPSTGTAAPLARLIGLLLLLVAAFVAVADAALRRRSAA